MEIIPAIDILDGKCVRLTKGDYDQKTIYSSNPLDVAKQFEDAGIRRLHLVDLDGARNRHVVNLEVLKSICTHTSLHVDFGGGVKTEDDLEKVFDSGAQQVTAGSISAHEPETVKGWISRYGADRIIIGADVLDEKIMVSGWQQSSGIELYGFLEDYVKHGARYIICTDISKDGMLSGPAYSLYRDIAKRFPELRIIASGGVSRYDDLEKLALDHVFGAIVGKAFYEGKVSLQQLKQMQDAN